MYHIMRRTIYNKNLTRTSKFSKFSTSEYNKNQNQVEHMIEWNEAKSMSDIPSPPKHWFLGHAVLMQKYSKNLHKMHNKLFKEYGNIVLLQNPGSPNIVCIYDPKDSRVMYEKDGQTPSIAFFEPMEFHRSSMRKDLFPSAGLISNGEEWRQNRSAVQQDMMRAKSATYYIKDIDETTVELRDLLDLKRGPYNQVNINPLLRLWGLESIARIFIATRLRALDPDLQKSLTAKEILKASEVALGTNLQLNYMPPIWKYVPYLVPQMRKHDQAMETIINLIKPHVYAALQAIDINDESDQSILAKFVKRNGKESPICLAMAVDALIAGIDTTGNTATFLLYHLSTHPEKQDILYEEICNVVGVGSEEIDESKLNKMKYLKACLHESQRMLPITVGTARISQVDMVLSGYQVPKGTFVFRGGQLMSNDPHNFETPDKFLPERWLRSNKCRASAHPHASLPFGHGPRNCIGKRFASLEIQILIIRLLQQYHFQYDGKPVDVETSLVSKPDRDVILKVFDRKLSNEINF